MDVEVKMVAFYLRVSRVTDGAGIVRSSITVRLQSNVKHSN
jgi:hypothetical protein